MTNPFSDLYRCESCMAFIDAQDTEVYSEYHGTYHVERLSRTKCCRASYTDVDEQAVVDELGRIRELEFKAIFDGKPNEGRG